MLMVTRETSDFTYEPEERQDATDSCRGSICE